MDISKEQAKALANFLPRLNSSEHFDILIECESGLEKSEVERQNWEHQVQRLRDELFLIRGGRDIDFPDSFEETGKSTAERYELTYFGDLVLEGLRAVVSSSELIVERSQFFERTPFWDYFLDEEIFEAEFEIEIEHRLANQGMPSSRLNDLIGEATHIREILPWNPGGDTFIRCVEDDNLSAEVIQTARLVNSPYYDTSTREELMQTGDVEYYTYEKEFPFILAVAETPDGERGIIWSRGLEGEPNQGAVLRSDSDEFLSWAHALFDAVLNDTATSGLKSMDSME